MVDCLGGAPSKVDCFAGAAGNARPSFSLWISLTVMIPPWRSVGTDLSAVITWACLGLCAAEPHVLYFLCTCQLDLARVSEFRSIERFSTEDTGHRTLYNRISLYIYSCTITLTVFATVFLEV
jgi:hypothetical protein